MVPHPNGSPSTKLDLQHDRLKRTLDAMATSPFQIHIRYDIHDDIPCLALAETANGLRTGRYAGTDTPEPVEFDDVVEAQQTVNYCVEMSTRVERGTAKAFFRNEHHALYRRTPYGNQVVIPKSSRERVLTIEHHATVAAHPGMNRMYYC